MKKHISAYVICLFLIFLACNVKNEAYQAYTVKNENTKREDTLYAGFYMNWSQRLSKQEREELWKVFRLEESDIYSFLQGPRAWAEQREWSGEWCEFGVRGNSFGGFGCGLCCMANIYNSLTPYEVSPWDMFEYAKTASGYSPTGKVGAIDWGDMKQTLRSCGMTCDLYYKPESYEEFQRQMKYAKSMIALICSGNDDTYWQDVPGHYVNLWLYEEETDTVFLAEPGNPENNRTRIPLRYVYDALKTLSKFQYLRVDGYQEENNQWRADGIDEAWNIPSSGG